MFHRIRLCTGASVFNRIRLCTASSLFHRIRLCTGSSVFHRIRLCTCSSTFHRIRLCTGSSVFHRIRLCTCLSVFHRIRLCTGQSVFHRLTLFKFVSSFVICLDVLARWTYNMGYTSNCLLPFKWMKLGDYQCIGSIMFLCISSLPPSVSAYLYVYVTCIHLHVVYAHQWKLYNFFFVL